MATKAEQAKSAVQRSGKKKPKKARRPRRDSPVDTAAKGVSATNRKVGAGSSGSRNRSKRVAKRGGAKLENSKTGKPSRKSTRKASGGVKRTNNLKRRAVQKARSPKTRARKAAAKRK